MHRLSNSRRPLTPPEDFLAGVGLRAPFVQDLLQRPVPIGWLEVHPENYFGGGLHLKQLQTLREFYPLSFHAVGLSLGSVEKPDSDHLAQIKELMDIFQPFQLSDHASWSASGNAHMNDLLPLPYTAESLDVVCRNVMIVQEAIGAAMVVENPSTYIAYAGNEMSEPEFMNAIAARTGCGILLDVNNIYVQSHNHGLNPFAYIDAVAPKTVKEFHLAGHTERDVAGEIVLIDTHSRAVRDEVWDLYAYALRRFGPRPSLIEWDQDFPTFAVLQAEAQRVHAMLMDNRHAHENAA